MMNAPIRLQVPTALTATEADLLWQKAKAEYRRQSKTKVTPAEKLSAVRRYLQRVLYSIIVE
jgi:hypothetical protein